MRRMVQADPSTAELPTTQDTKSSTEVGGVLPMTSQVVCTVLEKKVEKNLEEGV